MKKEEKEVRKIFVKVRMNGVELDLVKKHKQKTTERSLSNYIRKVCTGTPVTVKYRNSSADDFLHDMLQLKRELNAIGNNFNQAVHKLHMLDRIPEFRTWVEQYDGLHRMVVDKVEEINLKVNKLYEQWLQG